jgi:nitrogen regulatory protein P-II 1
MNDMNLILAIIQSNKLDEVKSALVAIGIQGITVVEAKGFGHQKGTPLSFLGLYRPDGKAFTVDFLPKIQLEMIVPSEMSDLVVETIVKNAHTGKIGDGKVFVLPVLKAVRIRTGETNEESLASFELETEKV